MVALPCPRWHRKCTPYFHNLKATYMNFCNYCSCSDCQYGTTYLYHAETINGDWICDVCYLYDECVIAKIKLNQFTGPCPNKDCEHRPKIIGEWIKG